MSSSSEAESIEGTGAVPPASLIDAHVPPEDAASRNSPEQPRSAARAGTLEPVPDIPEQPSNQSTTSSSSNPPTRPRHDRKPRPSSPSTSIQEGITRLADGRLAFTRPLNTTARTSSSSGSSPTHADGESVRHEQQDRPHGQNERNKNKTWKRKKSGTSRRGVHWWLDRTFTAMGRGLFGSSVESLRDSRP
jgi:hypothetical protein